MSPAPHDLSDEEHEVLRALRRSPQDRELLLTTARLDPEQRDSVLSVLRSFLRTDVD